MDESEGLYLAQLVMSSSDTVQLEMPIPMVWLLINSLQLTAIHPDLHEPIRSMNEDIGRQLGALVLRSVPEVEPLLEMGWHRENDVITGGDDDLPFARG